MKLLLPLVVAVYLCLVTVAAESHRKPNLGTLWNVLKKGMVRLCRGVQLLDDVEFQLSQVTTAPDEITATPDATVPRTVPDPIHNDDSSNQDIHINTTTSIDLLDSGLMGLLIDVCDKEIVPDETDGSRNDHSKNDDREGKHENKGRAGFKASGWKEDMGRMRKAGSVGDSKGNGPAGYRWVWLTVGWVTDQCVVVQSKGMVSTRRTRAKWDPDTLKRSYFSFQPVLHDWCNKGRGMCYPVCGMVHIKEPLLLIGKSSLCGGSRFPFSLSEWSLTICLTP